MICPHCKIEIQGILSTGPMAPAEGDLTICLDCAQPSIFFITEKAELELRMPKDKRERFECDIAVGTLVAYAIEGIEEDSKDLN